MARRPTAARAIVYFSGSWMVAVRCSSYRRRRSQVDRGPRRYFTAFPMLNMGICREEISFLTQWVIFTGQRNSVEGVEAARPAMPFTHTVEQSSSSVHRSNLAGPGQSKCYMASRGRRHTILRTMDPTRWADWSWMGLGIFMARLIWEASWGGNAQ